MRRQCDKQNEELSEDEDKKIKVTSTADEYLKDNKTREQGT